MAIALPLTELHHGDLVIKTDNSYYITCEQAEGLGNNGRFNGEEVGLLVFVELTDTISVQIDGCRNDHLVIFSQLQLQRKRFRAFVALSSYRV